METKPSPNLDLSPSGSGTPNVVTQSTAGGTHVLPRSLPGVTVKTRGPGRPAGWAEGAHPVTRGLRTSPIFSSVRLWTPEGRVLGRSAFPKPPRGVTAGTAA